VLVQAFCVDAEPDAGGRSTPRQRELCDRARRELGYTSGEPSKPAFLNAPAHFFPTFLSAIIATEYPAGDAYDSLDDDADAGKASDFLHREADLLRGRRATSKTIRA
jgi:hypothetical protein